MVSSHPRPLNHVRFRALSCTLRGAGLSLPPAFAEAASRRQAEGEGNRYSSPFKGEARRGMGYMVEQYSLEVGADAERRSEKGTEKHCGAG